MKWFGRKAARQDSHEVIPEQVNPRLPGGFNLPPFGVHQMLAVVIVSSALWAVGAIWLGMQGAAQWVGSWQQDIHIHVYLDTNKGDAVDALTSELKTIRQVDSVRLISQTEAARWMSEWLSDSSLSERDLVQRLPLTLELTLNDERSEFLFDDIRDMAERAGGSVNEEEVSMAQAHEWISNAGLLAWFASLILAMAMSLIISNTLRMTLLARADEIHLMRLMGAKEWFVRMPFILEGALLGAIAGVAAWVLLWPLVIGTSAWFEALQVDLNLWVQLLPLAVGVGVVGTVGAVIATAQVESRDSAG